MIPGRQTIPGQQAINAEQIPSGDRDNKANPEQLMALMQALQKGGI
jgi:hypothetical protein